MKVNKLYAPLTILSLISISCGGGGGSGSSSSNSVVPMISNIECADGPCASSGSSKTSSSAIMNYGVEFYDSINDEVIPEMQTSMTEMDKVLKLANISSCDNIPANGEETITYEGNTIKVVVLAPTSNTANLFGQSVATTKAVKAYNEDDEIFFHAEFNCETPRVGFVQADYTVLDSSDNNKFIIHFYENGAQKKLALFTEYLNSDTSKEEAYMSIFSTDGEDFEGHFGYTSDTSVGGEAVLAFNSDSNGIRIVSGLSTSTLNFLSDSGSTLAEDASDAPDYQYCYSAEMTAQACGSHPAINILNGNENAEGLTQATSTGDFTLAKLTSLDFSF